MGSASVMMCSYPDASCFKAGWKRCSKEGGKRVPVDLSFLFLRYFTGEKRTLALLYLDRYQKCNLHIFRPWNKTLLPISASMCLAYCCPVPSCAWLSLPASFIKHLSVLPIKKTAVSELERLPQERGVR